MSMNLAFETVQGRYLVDFPFQTPTNLSYAVYNAQSVSERMKLIQDQLVAWKWEKHEIKAMMKKICLLMSDSSLRLIVV